jgi:hypothetical protein
MRREDAINKFHQLAILQVYTNFKGATILDVPTVLENLWGG